MHRAARPVIAPLLLALALAACGSDDTVVIAVPAQPVVAGLGLELTRIDLTAVRIDWSFDPIAASYLVSRDGYELALIPATSLVDASVLLGARHCYQILGLDVGGLLVSQSQVGCITIF